MRLYVKESYMFIIAVVGSGVVRERGRGRGRRVIGWVIEEVHTYIYLYITHICTPIYLVHAHTPKKTYRNIYIYTETDIYKCIYCIYIYIQKQK